MSELVENDEGLPPGVAGGVVLAVGVVGVAETDQRLDFADAIAQLQVQLERLPVTAFGQVVLTEVVVCVPKAVERRGLTVEVAEFLEQGEGSPAVPERSVVVSEEGVAVADPVERLGVSRAVAGRSEQVEGLPVGVEADLTYYLFFTRAAGSLDFCLDAKAQTIGNGGIVQLWTCNGGNQQQWAFYRNVGTYTYLKNRASPAGRTLVLDAKAQTIGNGGAIQLWDYNGQAQQRWAPYGNDALRNVASPAGHNYVLDAKAQEIRDGGKIQLWEYNGGPQQQWDTVQWDVGP